MGGIVSRKLRVGINGFGRIGRILLRYGFDQVEFVGINSGSGDVATQAHLLKYDSTHGRFAKSVETYEHGLLIDGQKVPMSFEQDPAKIPWGEWGADIVFECTGAFKDTAANKKHIEAGAKRVVVSAPAKVDATFVYGINHKDYDPKKHWVVSNASCTTNCLAPVAKVLDEQFGIEKGLMTTIHSYTNDQRVLDSSHSDLRRARSAALSMIPTSTGAATAVAQVLPQLKGKIDGTSVRVPTPNVSLVDFTATLKKSVTADQINQAFIAASKGELRGVLNVTNDPVVSIDMNGVQDSSVIDLDCTFVIGDNMVKVLSWYDNEVGFSCRMIDLARYMYGLGL